MYKSEWLPSMWKISSVIGNLTAENYYLLIFFICMYVLIERLNIFSTFKIKAGQGQKECKCGWSYFIYDCQKSCPQTTFWASWNEGGSEQPWDLEDYWPWGECKAPGEGTARSPAIHFMNCRGREKKEMPDLKLDSLESLSWGEWENK